MTEVSSQPRVGVRIRVISAYILRSFAGSNPYGCLTEAEIDLAQLSCGRWKLDDVAERFLGCKGIKSMDR